MLVEIVGEILGAGKAHGLGARLVLSAPGVNPLVQRQKLALGPYNLVLMPFL